MTIALYLLAPLVVILVSQRVPLLDKIGVVPLTFLSGFIAAVTFNPGAMAPDLQQTVSEVSIALALPLIIFAANIARAVRDAGSMLKAIGAAFISVMLVAILGAVIFDGRVAHVDQVAGMSVGAYTGSGINMGAIKTAINGDQDVFLTMITYDIVFSAIYLVVVLLAGQRIAGLVLRPYSGETKGQDSNLEHLADDSAHAYKQLLARGGLARSGLALLAAIIIVAASVGIAGLFPEGASSVATILSITTLALIGSMIPQLHRIKTSFHLGMYLILVFCFASATMLDTRIFTAMDWGLGSYVLFVIFGSMLMQVTLCRIMGLDRDTYLIASGAAVMSVPFIPVIAGALKNRALLIPGIAVAVIGYAIGNYLGVMVASIVGRIAGV